MIRPQSREQDRRRFQRFPVSSDVDVHFQLEGGHEPLKAKLADISYPLRGLKLVSNYAVPAQSTVKLESISDQEESIPQCDGGVAWCRKSVPGKVPEAVYQIGLNVSAESTETQQVLDTRIPRLISVWNDYSIITPAFGLTRAQLLSVLNNMIQGDTVTSFTVYCQDDGIQKI